MAIGRHGTGAYQAVADLRSQREQDADVFRRATSALRASQERTPIDRARALADNRRLWITLSDLMRDPTNPLPRETRAGIISIGIAVQKEMELPAPDFAFLIGVNDTITAGLDG